MKLTRLQIKNFIGIGTADLDLSGATCHVFLGDNNSGKSSVVDSVEYLLTGQCRGMMKKKDAEAFLLKHGGQDMSVSAAWDGGQMRRSPSGCSLAERDIEAIFGPDSRVRASLSGFRFLATPPRDRRELVAGVTGKKADTGAALAKVCKEAGLPDDMTEKLVKMADEDLDHAETFAVEQRKAAKRSLEAYKDPGLQAPGKVLIGGKEFDLTTVTVEAVMSRLATRKKEHNDALRAAGTASLLDRPEIIEAKLAEADKEVAALPPDNPGALNKAMGDIRTIEAVISTAKHAGAVAEGKLAAARAAAEAIDKLGKAGNCPTCRQALDADRVAKLAAQATDAGDQAGEEVTAAKEQIAKAEKDKVAACAKAQTIVEGDQARALLVSQRAKLTADLEESKSHDALEAKAEELGKAVALGEKLLEAAQLYSAGKTRIKNEAEIRRAVEVWDKVAKALGPESDIRKATSKGFDLAIVRDAADKLLSQGRQVDVDADWNITCGGTWSNGLSRSERLRLGAGFATAFAVASGLKLVVIDEADILVPANRKLLTGWLMSQAVDTVLMASTRPDKPAAGSPDPRVKLWWCEGGEVVGL